jgi:hypothetical protein
MPPKDIYQAIHFHIYTRCGIPIAGTITLKNKNPCRRGFKRD